MDKLNVLVTGCAGFIGSHLCDKLVSLGYEVTGIDNFDPFYSRTLKEQNISGLITQSNFHFIEADLRLQETYNKLTQSFDLVVHLAAKAGVRPSIEKPEEYIDSNIRATQLLLNWMQKSEVKKLIFASSSSVYGDTSKSPFIESEDVSFPISPYAASKKSCELLNYTFHHLYNFDIINLRFFTVYGPRQRPDLAIRKFVNLIQSGSSIQIYGDGTTERDYTFIEDIINGILLAMDFVKSNDGIYESINLGRGEPIKLIELIDSIYSILKFPRKIEMSPEQPGDVKSTYASIEKAKKLLGYNPKFSIQSGLFYFLK